MQYGESCPEVLCPASPLSHDTAYSMEGVAMAMPDPGCVREIRENHGRRYRVDESPEVLIGRPRSSVLRQASLPMPAAGVLQYGCGAAVPLLTEPHGWRLGRAY